MKIGMVGLGKLGLPCAVAMDARGHDVMGFDANPAAMSKEPRPYRETGPDGVLPFDPHLARSGLRFGSLEQVAAHAEMIFVAVQTPHDPRYEGISRMPKSRTDFDYRYLCEAIDALAAVIRRETVVVVISTVLPGTFRRHVAPRANRHMRLCYNPFFIAMGTTMRDFLNPEFVLFGVHDEGAARTAAAFYETITDAPFYRTTVENAELIKVSYNTFIGMKIAFANTLMEICHKTPGTDVDGVTDALRLATTRLISGKYLTGGMGDGGGCHPRDNIAMSWLARNLDLSFDFFDAIMVARERQTEWLADLMCAYELPKAILGTSFKPETNIRTGSPSILLRTMLEERGHRVLSWDPYVDDETLDVAALEPHVFLIGTAHAAFRRLRFPAGSVVIDPWRYIPAAQGDVTYVAVGGAEAPAVSAARSGAAA